MHRRLKSDGGIKNISSKNVSKSLLKDNSFLGLNSILKGRSTHRIKNNHKVIQNLEDNIKDNYSMSLATDRNKENHDKINIEEEKNNKQLNTMKEIKNDLNIFYPQVIEPYSEHNKISNPNQKKIFNLIKSSNISFVDNNNKQSSNIIKNEKIKKILIDKKITNSINKNKYISHISPSPEIKKKNQKKLYIEKIIKTKK